MAYDQLVRPVRSAQGGEYATLNPNAVNISGPQFMKVLVNCTLENDLWETEPGTRQMNTNALGGAPLVGTVVQFYPRPLVSRIVACARDGTIWVSADGGLSFVLVKSGLTAGALMVPVEGGAELAGNPKKLFLFGGGPPQVLAGDPSTDTGLANPVTPLTAVVLKQSGAINLGLHVYTYTWVNAIGETAQAPGATVIIANGNQAQVELTVPVGPAGTLSRNVYRTRVSDGLMLKLTTLNDNGTTDYVDNFSDGQLGTITAPVVNATTSIHQISRPPLDWSGGNQPTGGFILEGRLAAFGNNNGQHFVYVSTREDHEDFLSKPILIPVFTGQGDRITAGTYWRSQGWVWKSPRGVYRIDTSAVDPTQWQTKEHSTSVGCVGPMALVVVQGSDDTQFFDDVVFIEPDGSWHRLSKVQAYQLGDVNASSISEKTYGQFIKDQIDKTRLPFCQLIYFSQIEEVWGAFSLLGSATNNLRLKMNIKRMPEYGIRFHHSLFPVAEGLGLMINVDATRTPIAGCPAGIIKACYQSAYSDAGQAFTGNQGEFWTWDDNFQDLGEAYKIAMKNYHFLLVEGVTTGDWSLIVEVYIDGIKQPTVLSIPLKGKGGPFILDQSRLDQTALGTVKPIFRTSRLRGRGHRIAYRGYLTTAGQYFRISQVQTLFSLGGYSGGNK